MNIDKEQLKKEIAELTRKRKIFSILAFTFLGVAVASLIAGLSLAIVINSQGQSASDALIYTYWILDWVSSGFLTASLVMFVIRSFVYSSKIRIRQMLISGEYQDYTGPNPYAQANTVDVKPVPEEKEKTRDEMLLEQYKDLCDRGIISKEDYQKKEEELSHKS